jgi:dTDP-4-dehydrorhamnose 3,5-epimerase
MVLTMRIESTPIDGVFVIEGAPVQDARGEFLRAFCARELSPVLGGRAIAQINHSVTREAGAIRGLHFQRPPHAEMKLVRCLRGAVWDVVLDLRRESPTFMKWHAAELSPGNARMMVVPERCAHGFQTLAPDSALLYLHTAFYAPEAEGGLHYADPRAAIGWPLPPGALSDRDRSLPCAGDDFGGV